MNVGRARARRELVRFYKFLIVGTIGAVVDFGTFNLLTALLGVWSVLASVFSFIAAVTSNFIWNRYWTYPDSRSKTIGGQAVQFALVNLIGLVIRTPIFAFAEKPATRLAGIMLAGGVPYLARTPLAALDPIVLGRNLALALAVLAVLLWNFGVNRIWTYSDVE
ncbi:MAG: GtrA family protein [Anaerolineales bacterium]